MMFGRFKRKREKKQVWRKISTCGWLDCWVHGGRETTRHGLDLFNRRVESGMPGRMGLDSVLHGPKYV